MKTDTPLENIVGMVELWEKDIKGEMEDEDWILECIIWRGMLANEQKRLNEEDIEG